MTEQAGELVPTEQELELKARRLVRDAMKDTQGSEIAMRETLYDVLENSLRTVIALRGALLDSFDAVWHDRDPYRQVDYVAAEEIKERMESDEENDEVFGDVTYSDADSEDWDAVADVIGKDNTKASTGAIVATSVAAATVDETIDAGNIEGQDKLTRDSEVVRTVEMIKQHNLRLVKHDKIRKELLTKVARAGVEKRKLQDQIITLEKALKDHRCGVGRKRRRISVWRHASDEQ